MTSTLRQGSCVMAKKKQVLLCRCWLWSSAGFQTQCIVLIYRPENISRLSRH